MTESLPTASAEQKRSGEHQEGLTQFEEPAFSVRVEESVRQVIPIILWDLEGLILDAVIQIL